LNTAFLFQIARKRDTAAAHGSKFVMRVPWLGRYLLRRNIRAAERDQKGTARDRKIRVKLLTNLTNL
jgi:hypothetical protein